MKPSLFSTISFPSLFYGESNSLSAPLILPGLHIVRLNEITHQEDLLLRDAGLFRPPILIPAFGHRPEQTA